jgi:hypothetical protein
VIRINHVTLPAGLSAFARRSPDGDLEVFVSEALPPDRQRAAVRVALRASRRSGWRGALLPVPVAVMLAGRRGWLSRIGRALRLHPVASSAAATLAVTGAAVAVAVLPHLPGHVSAGQLPAPAAVAPVPGHSGASTRPTGGPRGRSHGRTAKPHPAQGESPAPGQASAAGSGHSVAPTPVESRQPSPAQGSSPVTTQPSPSPAPSPTSTQGGESCVPLLFITVCL